MEFTVFIKYRTRRKEAFEEFKCFRPDDFFNRFEGSAYFACKDVAADALISFLQMNGSRNVQILSAKCGYKAGVLSDWFEFNFST